MIHCILQIVGFLMLYIGFDLIFQLFPVLFRIIPFLGKWIQLFGNFLAAIAAFLISGCLWCITVALAWLSMRPVKAILLLAVACALVLAPTYLSTSPAA